MMRLLKGMHAFVKKKQPLHINSTLTNMHVGPVVMSNPFQVLVTNPFSGMDQQSDNRRRPDTAALG